MHITNDRFHHELSAMEKAHLATCESCRSEHQKIALLCESAQHIELITPPEGLWNNIEPKLPAVQHTTGRWQKFVYGSAASVLFAAVSWMMWNQFMVQQQLEQVLISNMLLEEKIHLQQQVTFRQASLIEKLQALDVELMNADSSKEKLKILTQRRELIQQHILNKEEQSREISI